MRSSDDPADLVESAMAAPRVAKVLVERSITTASSCRRISQPNGLSNGPASVMWTVYDACLLILAPFHLREDEAAQS